MNHPNIANPQSKIKLLQESFKSQNQTIRLDFMNFKDIDVQQQTIKQNKHVKHLNLCKNDFTWKGVITISRYTLPSLEKINLSQIHIQYPLSLPFGKAFTNLTSLNLSENIVGSQGAKMLTKSDMKKMISLKLNNCHLSDIGLIHLHKADWKQLANLQLSDNEIQSDGPYYLIRGNWKNITQINLNWNKMAKQGALKFLSANWNQLTTLWARYNNIIPTSRPQLKSSIQKMHPQRIIIEF